MEFNAKNIAIAVACAAAFIGSVVIITKLIESNKEAEPMSAEDLEAAKQTTLNTSSAQMAAAVEGLDMASIYDTDGTLTKKVRSALVEAIYNYALTSDLNERHNRKHISVLDGIEDVAVRNELARVAKRVVGSIYKAAEENPEQDFTLEFVDTLID